MFYNVACIVPNMTTLGERITRAVTGSAIDPAEIAKACEVTVQSVYGWMRGEVKDLKNETARDWTVDERARDWRVAA